MITHFYSDPHFGHANIIKHANRPFAEIEEMNAELIARYQSEVGDNDFVMWLGDCAWSMPLLRDVLNALPGRKGLIRGNHDKPAAVMAHAGFDFVAEQMWIRLANTNVLLCHYPPIKAVYSGREFDDRFADKRPRLTKGQVCIHGHTHERKRIFLGQRRIHVGVDAWNFAPAPIQAVTELVRGQK